MEDMQELAEFDPSLGNLSTQMRRMNFDQWFATLQHVLRVFHLMCHRVRVIQEAMQDNIEHFLEVIANRPVQDEEVNDAEQFVFFLFINSIKI